MRPLAVNAEEMTSLSNLLPAEIGLTRLRRFLVADVMRFHAYRSDHGLARFQAWSPITEGAARGFVEEMSSIAALLQGGWIQLAIADAVTNDLIGDVGIHLSSDGCEAEVGFTLCRMAQRKGHATAAVKMAAQLVFQGSGTNIIRGVTDARNLASIGVLERVGVERAAERACEFKGEPCTEYVYALLRTGT